MGEDKNSKKLEHKIIAALEKYEPALRDLEPVERALARQVTILVERAGGRAAAAAETRVGATTLDNYRSGKTQPKFLDLMALCRAAGVTLTDVVEAEEDFGENAVRAIVSPELYAGPEIHADLLAEIGEMVAALHVEAGLTLSKNNQFRLAAEGYNRLTDRARDPYNRKELESMMPWLRLSFIEDIEEQKSKPGSGKLSAS